MNIDMIVFTDVDGTIYDYSGRLPEGTAYAIKKMRENSHKVFMVTGRSKAENKPELLDIGFDGMIGGNGSYIEVDGKVLMHKTISLEQCRHIVEWCRSRNIEYYEESNNGLFASEGFCESAKDAIRKYMTGKGMPADETEDIDVRAVFHGLVEGERLVRDDLNKVSFLLNSYQDYLDALIEFADMEVGSWGGKGEEALFGELGPKGIDKAKAIEILLDYLCVSREDTIAIGDAKQDIVMLKMCGTGVTFSSGGEEIKKIADYVTDDVDKDGFRKAFEHFGLI
ncbi:MAG: HAD family phosphatase [Erysipelotrichaceae bacterium]|nr:HAD family phosphatase [Erysipelotrichaceae bacterium]